MGQPKEIQQECSFYYGEGEEQKKKAEMKEYSFMTSRNGGEKRKEDQQ